MEPKELMTKLFGEGAPYPGQEVEWECFAGADAIESGMYKGTITQISWCQHCGLPTISATSEHGARFTLKISKDGKLVCGSEAPE